jgi:hypothetical protein
MRSLHIVTLPEVQAQMWFETLTTLNIKAIKNCGQVKCLADNEKDLAIAWELFREEFERTIK